MSARVGVRGETWERAPRQGRVAVAICPYDAQLFEVADWHDRCPSGN